MKAQTTAIVAIVAILAITLASVSGVTYSWWSDSESSEITISTGYVDVSTSDYVVEGDSLLSSNGVSADKVPSSISLIYTDDDSLVSDSDTLYVSGNPSDVKLKIMYTVTFDASVSSKYMINVVLPEGIGGGYKIIKDTNTVENKPVVVDGFKTINDQKDVYTVEITITSMDQKVNGSIVITNTITQSANPAQFITNSDQLKESIEDLGTATEKDVTLALGSGNFDTNLSIPGSSNVTFIGNGEDTVLSGQIASTSSNEGVITFKDLTINVSDAIADSTGISQTSKSAIAIWGNQTVICENVIFNMDLPDSTAITSWWDTGVGTTIIVKDCTFNCNGERPIRATGNVTVENCEFNDPYRYAVQLTAKASTATELDKAIVNFKNNTITNGPNGKDFVYGIQLEGADYGCNDLVINGSGNTIVNGGADSTLYYCECGKVNHATIELDLKDGVMVHENPQDVFTDCLDAGMTEINLPAGTYTIPSSVAGKTLTIIGADGAKIDFTKAYDVGGACITFKNLSFEGVESNSLNGFGIHNTTQTITYEGCTFENAVTNEYFGKVVYKECKFVGMYYITTYAVSSATFTDCVFDRDDSRAVLVYSHGNNPCTVSLERCTFKAAAMGHTWGGDWTAAVEVDTTNIPTAGTEVTINNCTFDENYNGIVRDKSASGKANAVITVDGAVL